MLRKRGYFFYEKYSLNKFYYWFFGLKVLNIKKSGRYSFSVLIICFYYFFYLLIYKRFIF